MIEFARFLIESKNLFLYKVGIMSLSKGSKTQG